MRSSNSRKPTGWRSDPARHSLAAKGIKTGSALPERGWKNIDPRTYSPRQLTTLHVWEDTAGHWAVEDESRGAVLSAQGDYNQPPGNVYIVLFKVSPESEGHGTRLYKELEADWKRRGYKTVQLETTFEGHEFWKKMGFKYIDDATLQKVL